MSMSTETRAALSRTIRALRERLLTDLSNEVTGRYRLDTSAVGLEEEAWPHTTASTRARRKAGSSARRWTMASTSEVADSPWAPAGTCSPRGPAGPGAPVQARTRTSGRRRKEEGRAHGACGGGQRR